MSDLRGTGGIPVPANGNFQGRPARGQRGFVAREAGQILERRYSNVSRYDRRARVTAVESLTPTGTVRLGFEVVDDQPFSFLPGNFVGIEGHVEGLGYRRSPYCIVSAPSGDRRFDLIVRVVPDGPLSQYLAARAPGDEVAFRGPKGRNMLPKDRSRDLVMIATGVAVGPCVALATHLLARGFDRRIQLFWGLRLREDVWSTDDLDALASRHPNFSYHVSLSQPPPGWEGLRGRVTETVPPLLTELAGKQFYLFGNGVMIGELAAALSDLGVAHQFIYEEAYFDVHHAPAAAVVAAIRSRFVADDLFSAFAHREQALFRIDRPLAERARNVDPLAPSDVVRGPDFLSHIRNRRRSPAPETDVQSGGG